MATRGRVQVKHEVSTGKNTGKWELSFQWCLYVYDDGTSEYGYRFIWRKPDGKLYPARGQARIESIKMIEELIQKAKDEDWGDYIAVDDVYQKIGTEDRE
jgi:hypothetical protein